MKPRQIFLYLAQQAANTLQLLQPSNQPVKCPLTSEPNSIIPFPFSPRRLIPLDIGTYSWSSLWSLTQLPISGLRILVLHQETLGTS